MNKLLLNTYLSKQLFDLARLGTLGLVAVSMLGIVSFVAKILEAWILPPIFMNLIVILILGIGFLAIILEMVLWGLSVVFTEIRCFMEIKGEAFEVKKGIELFLTKWKPLYKRRYLAIIPFLFISDIPEILEEKKLEKLEPFKFFLTIGYLIIILSLFMMLYFNNIVAVAMGIIGFSLTRGIIILKKHLDFREQINLKAYPDKTAEEEGMLYGFTVK